MRVAGTSVTEKNNQSRRQMLLDAGEHLRSAIDLLDKAAASGQIAAQLDFALHQVHHAITVIPEPGNSQVEVLGEEYQAARTSALQR